MAFNKNNQRPKAGAIGFALKLVLWMYLLAVRSYGELTRLEQQVQGSDGSLSFLVVGDWGRKGLYNQSHVAFQMGRVGKKLDIDFVVSTGDNFYDNGLAGLNDPAFKESFTDVYVAKSLQKQWYSVLGNHDYRGDTEVQLSPVLRKMDRRWLCLRSFILNAGIAEFFFVDTSPFVDDYFGDDGHTYDWRAVTPRETYISALLKDLNAALAKSTADWKIVVGHHGIRSIGHHGDTVELVEQLVPILKENKVDMYINGHDHCLEHITSHDGDIHYLTSGAGSKAWRGDVRSSNSDQHNLRFFHDGQGFMSVELTVNDAVVVFYDVHGKVLHRWKMSKELHSSM